MDDSSLPREEFRIALDELEVINRTLGGYRASLGGVARLVPEGARRLSVLDVGAGAGDFLRRLAAWSDRRGIALEALGIDIVAAIVEHARERSRGVPGLRFERADLLSLDGGSRYDVVHAAMMLHHMTDEEAVPALRKMHDLARRGVVINDIHRHRIAYHGIRLLTALLSRSRLVRHDAAVSVLRSFRRRELVELVSRAGLPAPHVRWRWAFRWEVVVPKRPGPVR